MYTTCLFCHADLGRNEALEAFPVGRRLAYDQAKGRLWVVCRRCERWNLTPQEARWEAMDQAERLYRATRLRASTDNVGLARLRDGTELVRIGAPLRPEFAAWRYGDQFGRRHRRRVLLSTATVIASAIYVAAPLVGVTGTSSLYLLYQGAGWVNAARRRRRGIAVGGGETPDVRVSILDAERTRLVPDPDRGYALVVGAPMWHWWHVWAPPKGEGTRIDGAAALKAAAKLLPRVNAAGGDAREVRWAVDLLGEGLGADALFARAAGEADRAGRRRGERGLPIAQFHGGMRLALEMAVHEEQERRALEGELRELEDAWRAAEEIAEIADDLLLPAGVTDRLAQLKARGASDDSGRSSARAGAASSPSSSSGAASSS